MHADYLKRMGIQSRQGSFYTPLDVVERLLSLSLGGRLEALTGRHDELPKVIDPTCGTGNFLVIAALQIQDRLVQLGMSPEDAIDSAVSSCVFGVDVDEQAVRTCRDSLSMLTNGRVNIADIARNVVRHNSFMLSFGKSIKNGQLDLFDTTGDSWDSLFPDAFNEDRHGFDLVIGNPPFLSQLEVETVLGSDETRTIRESFGDLITKLTNPSSVMMLIGLKLVSKDGSLMMIQPLSFLATAHSQMIRKKLGLTGQISDIWVCLENVFDASVQVVAVHIDLEASTQPTRIFSGRRFVEVGMVPQKEWEGNTWSSVLALAHGFPRVDVVGSGHLSQIAQASAAFRDQYYGLVGAVVEADGAIGSNMRLATVGLVDPAAYYWGEATTRFAKSQFVRPVVMLDQLSEDVRQWANTLKVPKVVVATQTKVIECFVDSTGDVLPSVPLITVRCATADLWKVAAVLSAPPISLLAAQRHLGAGISADVLRVTARELLELPLPANKQKWIEAAAVFEQLQNLNGAEERLHLLKHVGALMCDAYGVESGDVFDWWSARLPKRL